MLAQLRRLYYWPGMRKDIGACCRQCEGCAISRAPPSRPHGHYRKVSAGAPMDLIAIDILSGLPATADGHKYLLVATYYFTKWLEAIPLCYAEAQTCIRALYRLTAPSSAALASLANCIATRETTLRVSWWQSSARLRVLTKRGPRRFTLGLMARPSGRIGRSYRCSAPPSMRSPSHGQIVCPHCWRHIV